MKSKLSPTMREAIDYALARDGCLYRHPGGFWAERDWQLKPGCSEKWFSTSTIKALIKRDVAIYSDWVWTGVKSDKEFFTAISIDPDWNIDENCEKTAPPA